MKLVHPRASTNEHIRKQTQTSNRSVRGGLAQKFGVNPKTVQKWKNRDSVSDLPFGTKTLDMFFLRQKEGSLLLSENI